MTECKLIEGKGNVKLSILANELLEELILGDEELLGILLGGELIIVLDLDAAAENSALTLFWNELKAIQNVLK
jgi:hypothetical protein